MGTMNVVNDNVNESILSEIQSQWMNAETEKLKYKKLYEKERSKVNEYRMKSEGAMQKFEKCEIELSVSRHEFEELQQKHEVMEEVYLKLKQDLTRMMDRYSKMEYEHSKMQHALQMRDQQTDNKD